MLTGVDVRLPSFASMEYELWARVMEVYFRSLGLSGFLDGTVIRPESDRELQNKWDLNDARSTSLILQTLGPKQIRETLKCQNSRDVWIKLRETYSSDFRRRKRMTSEF